MGLRSQFESLLELKSRWENKADFYLVYGREAFPQQSQWPAPVPDGKPVANPNTVEQRCEVAERFQEHVSNDISILINNLDDEAMSVYDAYPFRVYAIDRQGKIAVPSTKGAAGFTNTINKIDSWLKNADNNQDPESLLANWSKLGAEEASRQIEAIIKRNRGTPLLFDDRVLFLVKHRGRTGPRLVGDFNEWAVSDGRFASAGQMQQIGKTSWHSYLVDVLPNARFEYAVQSEQEKLPDPLNRRVVKTFGSSHSEFVMPGARIGVAGDSPAEQLAGKVESFDFASQIWDNTRKIEVYLPPNYANKEKRYPILYVLDGDSWLTDGRLDATLDTLIKQKRLAPVIAVFVPPKKRAYEYGGSKKFRQFMMTELMPKIKKTYRTSRDIDDRAVLGVSRSGLAALDLAFYESGFGYAGVIAPAIRPLPFLDELKAGDAKPFRVGVMECAYDLEELRVQAQALRDILEEKQYKFEYAVAPITHSYNGWRHYVQDWLIDWKPVNQ